MTSSNGTDPYAIFAGASDFILRILWSGPEDKPFYKATLSSRSRAPSTADPFHGYAVISQREFGDLLEVLKANGLIPARGKYSASATEYFVEIEVPQETWHIGLGSD